MLFEVNGRWHTGKDIERQRIWHKEVPADDINVFKRLKLSKAKYHMINYSIIFVYREKI